MVRSSSGGPWKAPELLLAIIDTLESHGVDSDEYQLYHAIDIEALEQFLNSSSGAVEVQFRVEEIQLVVTPESVDVAVDGESHSGT